MSEFKRLRTEVRETELKDPNEDPTIAPGEDEPDDHVRNEVEASAIKDKLLSEYRKIHKSTVAAVTERWSFEEVFTTYFALRASFFYYSFHPCYI